MITAGRVLPKFVIGTWINPLIILDGFSILKNTNTNFIKNNTTVVVSNGNKYSKLSATSLGTEECRLIFFSF